MEAHRRVILWMKSPISGLLSVKPTGDLEQAPHQGEPRSATHLQALGEQSEGADQSWAEPCGLSTMRAGVEWRKEDETTADAQR